MKLLLSFWAMLVMLMVQPVSASDNWPVPDQYNSMENPVAFNNQHVRAGKDIYDKNCKSCHGDPGKYNALAMVPPPPDAASELMQGNTDGQLFYKVTTGRGAMPQFESTLSADERWKVITYIRRFDPRNEGKLSEEELLKGKIYALVGNNNTSIDIVAEVQDNTGNFTKLSNTPVFVQARKTFGNLLVGSVTTDDEGRASFMIPSGMQVKSDGKVDFILTLGEDFEPVTFSVAGVQVKAPEPLAVPSRVLWSTNDRTQVWLLITYFAALLGTWTIIGYIVLQIIRIREPSRKDEKK